MNRYGTFGFGKKEDKPFKVMHYEGIDSIEMDIPCTFLIKDDIININFASGSNVTLPMERVIMFEAMGMNDFMMKYKGANAPIKKNDIAVSYLVITYSSKDNTENRIVLWAANHREIMYFIDLHYKYKQSTENIEL